MLQHARMFGYRRPIMQYTRVFLPDVLASRFHRIHVAEQHLREMISDPERREKLPVEVGEGLRATRPGVLAPGSILAYVPGQHLYPLAPLTDRDAHKRHKAAREAVLAVTRFGERGDPVDPIEISIDQMCALVSQLPYDTSDEDDWVPRAIQGMLRSSKSRFDERGLLFCRKMTRKTRFTTGALSGDELTELRGMRRPVLCVFLDTGHKYPTRKDGPLYDGDYVYPTLVLPDFKDMPAHVFNADGD